MSKIVEVVEVFEVVEVVEVDEVEAGHVMYSHHFDQMSQRSLVPGWLFNVNKILVEVC